MSAHVRVPIPLTSRGASEQDPNFIRKILARVDPVTIFKQGRTLGAVWTDDKVALGKAVTMCGACVHKYHGWWRKYHYRGDWGEPYRADCDGCDIRNIRCTLFLPENGFHDSLGPAHGRLPEPGRRLFLCNSNTH